MKRFHYSLRLVFVTAALTTALLENQVLPLLATEAVLPEPASTPVDHSNATPAEVDVSAAPSAPETPSPEATAPETTAPAPAATAPKPPAAQPKPDQPQSLQVPESSPAAATATRRSTSDRADRVAATRQQMEERLAAIVGRDRAAKAAEFQQNLIASALHYAQTGDFVLARRTAQHPALSLEVQAETLAQIEAIAAAPSTAPAIAATPRPSRSGSATTALPRPQAPSVVSAREWVPPARLPQIQRTTGRLAIANQCLPQQATNRLLLTAPSAISAPAVSPSPPIKSIEMMFSAKPTIAKVSTLASTSPDAEGDREASSDRAAVMVNVIPNAAAAPIAEKLTNLAAAIRAVSIAPLVKGTAALPPSELQPKADFVGPAIALAIAKQTDAVDAMPLPSLPIVYVNANADSSQTTAKTVPAVANCTGANLTVSYPVRTGLMQRLGQLGITFPLPIPAAVTSAFGWRIHPITGDRRFHAGVDLGAPMGTPVMAALPGQVVAAGDRGGYGLAVIIENNVQRNLYAHLSGIAVQPGQTVAAGSVIGWVGSTGNSTGPHLHFESQYLTANGWQAVDPMTNGAIARGF